MAIPPVVALEIGTSKVLALVGELREDGHAIVTGMGEHPSVGVRKGEVIDLANAIACVRSTLAMAEESSKVVIRQVHLAVSGGHIQSLVSGGEVPIRNSTKEVTQDDIDQVMEVAKTVNLPADREILHSIRQHYRVDDQENVLEPEGMEGARLSLDMLVLHGIRSRMHNTIKVVKSVPMGVQDVAFSGLCSALSVLTPEQKKSGAIMIDLGGGTTDYVVYENEIVAAAGALGIGGDHITNDIALAFNIPVSQAETLKRESGHALADVSAEAGSVELPPEGGFSGRTVNLKTLRMVINLRTEEILDIIRKRLDRENLLHQIGAGVVLTGGGAHMKGISRLAEKVFGLPCSIGLPRYVTGLASATGGPEYATCSGLVQFGFKAMIEARHRSIGGWLKELLWG
jgi:cell division protein FtsA